MHSAAAHAARRAGYRADGGIHACQTTEGVVLRAKTVARSQISIRTLKHVEVVQMSGRSVYQLPFLSLEMVSQTWPRPR